MWYCASVLYSISGPSASFWFFFPFGLPLSLWGESLFVFGLCGAFSSWLWSLAERPTASVFGSLQKLLPVLLGFSPLTICFFLVNLRSWSEYGSLRCFLGSVKDRRSTGGPDHITGADSRPSCSLGKSLFLLGDRWVVWFLQVHIFQRRETDVW